MELRRLYLKSLIILFLQKLIANFRVGNKFRAIELLVHSVGSLNISMDQNKTNRCYDCAYSDCLHTFVFVRI